MDEEFMSSIIDSVTIGTPDPLKPRSLTLSNCPGISLILEFLIFAISASVTAGTIDGIFSALVELFGRDSYSVEFFLSIDTVDREEDKYWIVRLSVVVVVSEVDDDSIEDVEVGPELDGLDAGESVVRVWSLVDSIDDVVYFLLLSVVCPSNERFKKLRPSSDSSGDFVLDSSLSRSSYS